MSKVKTTQELHPVRLLAIEDLAAADWKVKEFNGEVKVGDNGKPLYRADGFQLFIVGEDGKVKAIRGDVSITVSHPIDISIASFYEPVGVFTWNDYERFKTSIVFDSLKQVGK